VHSFVSHRNVELFLLLRNNGIVVVEPPEGGKESVLRVFMTSADALFYREQDTRPNETLVRRTKLADLWSILGDINSNSLTRFGVPVRVELSGYHDGEVGTIEILHTTLRPSN
jgi:hypothetical protein